MTADIQSVAKKLLEFQAVNHTRALVDSLIAEGVKSTDLHEYGPFLTRVIKDPVYYAVYDLMRRVERGTTTAADALHPDTKRSVTAEAKRIAKLYQGSKA